jgi:hypothetical protein
MCCVLLVFEAKTGQIHLCHGQQLWNLGTVTTDGATRNAQAWLRGDWTPDPARGHTWDARAGSGRRPRGTVPGRPVRGPWGARGNHPAMESH